MSSFQIARAFYVGARGCRPPRSIASRRCLAASCRCMACCLFRSMRTRCSSVSGGRPLEGLCDGPWENPCDCENEGCVPFGSVCRHEGPTVNGRPGDAPGGKEPLPAPCAGLWGGRLNCPMRGEVEKPPPLDAPPEDPPAAGPYRRAPDTTGDWAGLFGNGRHGETWILALVAGGAGG